MPDNSFHVDVLTPRGLTLSIHSLYMELPGEDGRLGVMAGHQPAIVGLAAGLLVLRDADGHTSRWSIGRGHATITPLGVTVVTREATPAP
jgi:F-type H+-transporting ATPase subunit epsilon